MSHDTVAGSCHDTQDKDRKRDREKTKDKDKKDSEELVETTKVDNRK